MDLIPATAPKGGGSQSDHLDIGRESTAPQRWHGGVQRLRRAKRATHSGLLETAAPEFAGFGALFFVLPCPCLCSTSWH
jgi:hypothetical protein